MAPSFASQSTLICADDRSVPIFVVSLAKDNSRRAPFAAKMQELGLNFTFVDAVDGRQSLPSIYVHEVDRHSAKKRLHRDISDGELACSLSHIHLYKTVMDREDIGAVILEDDAIIGTAIKEFVQGKHYEGKSMVLLGHENALVSRKRQHMFEAYSFRKLNWPADLAVAYYVSRETAAHLYHENTPVSYVADWGSDITRYGALVIDPPIVGAILFDQTQSSLEGQRDKLIKGAARRTLITRTKRFAKPKYWKKKYVKIVSEKLAGSSTVTDIR